MPHFANVQVWHLPYSSAAFALSKCGIPDSEVWYLFTPSPSFFLTTTSFFSLLFLSYLLLRARGQVFIVSICIIVHYDVFSFPIFSSSFLIVLQSFCISLRVSIKINGRFFCGCRKSYPEKDIKSIGTSNIFPYLCPIIEL